MRRELRNQLRIGLLLLLALGIGSSNARAQQWSQSPEGSWSTVAARREPAPMFEPDSRLRLIGVTLLAGLPDGIAPGISIHPGTNLVHLDLGVSGLLSFGVRAGATLDPFDWVLAPTLTLAGGYSGWASVPSSTTEYQLYYINIQPGLEVGRRSRFRMFLRAGYSHLWVAARSPATYQGLQATSQPSLRINFLPSVNLGVTAYFGL
jgi:hypothetical protein